MAVHVAIASDDAGRGPLSEDIEQGGLASTGLAHERSQPAGRSVSGDIVQQLPRLASANWHGVVEMVERERLVDLRHGILGLCATRTVIHGCSAVATAALLLVRRCVLLRGADDFRLGAALEEHDVRLGVQGLVDLVEEEQDSNEGEAERTDDAEVAPDVAVAVVVRARDVGVAIDDRGTRGRADGGADLVRERDVLVSRTLRDEVGTGALKAVEFVRDETFETVMDRLSRKAVSEGHLIAVNGVKTHVDPGDPLQRSDHVRLGQ